MGQLAWCSWINFKLHNTVNSLFNIRENLIFANIREFDRSRIQRSLEMHAYIEFTLENVIHRKFKFKFPRKRLRSENREIKNTVIYSSTKFKLSNSFITY